MIAENKTDLSCSVAIAAYKGEKYISEQLESLFTQSRLPDEIVICDDSPDKATEELVKNLMNSSPCKIYYHHNDSTLGVNDNFSKAISLCSGDIIFLCDQDDFWLPEKIKHMLDVLYNNSSFAVRFPA